MAEDTFPVRKTTLMALNSLLMVQQRAFQELAQAALDDGEAPEGYTLDLDRKIWRRPDIAPKGEAPSNEPKTSTG